MPPRFARPLPYSVQKLKICRKGRFRFCGSHDNKMLKKTLDLFVNCGLTREEYRSVKKDAYTSYFHVWKHLQILLMIGFAVLSVSFAIREGLTPVSLFRIAVTAYFALASIFFHYFCREDSLSGQLIVYISMIVLLLFALSVSLLHPETLAVTFIVLLVTLPMFMVDRPFYMAILLASAVTVYLFCVHSVKSPDLFRTEMIFSFAYGAFGIIINTFYNSIRAKEFMLLRREREHTEDEKSASEETNRLNTALKRMSESALELLGDVLEGRDTESGEHIRRVKGFSYILANEVKERLPEYGLDDYTVDLIAYTSALHDVGKISIPDAILCKPGKLTKEEFEVMKTHCERGCSIISKMKDKWSRDYLDMGISICRNHHEKWDGKGYPRGLSGDDIPIAAQIVSIADIFDALITKRVYKDAYTFDEAYRMIMAGECGAFSEKLLRCFSGCFERFTEHAGNLDNMTFSDRDYEIVFRNHPDESFVIGLHDDARTLREKLRLDEELSVMECLSETYCYVCYVDMPKNEVIRFRADKQFAQILDSFSSELKPNERFDKLLNSIIVSEDYAEFRRATERSHAMQLLSAAGHMTTDFRIRLEDGVHYCRMRISLDPKNPNAVIIGIAKRDEEHEAEMRYLTMKQSLEDKEKLAERLAVIDCVSSEYDYVCSLNADTMDVVVYRAEEWICDMFKNLEDIVVSPDVRSATLKGIILDEDFAEFQAASRHEAVLRGLAEKGVYCVNYRAYKYGKLVNYQTRYTLDKNNPRRIIIGLRSLGTAER